MTEYDDDDDVSNGTTAAVVGGNNNHRKRRLSKREWRNLKRNRPVVVGLDVGGGRREEEEDAVDASPDSFWIVPHTSQSMTNSKLWRKLHRGKAPVLLLGMMALAFIHSDKVSLVRSIFTVHCVSSWV